MDAKRLLIAAVSLMTIAIATTGPTHAAQPEQLSVVACDEHQEAYVEDRIRQECGIWGGRAWVTCDGHSIEIHSISCNEDPD